jgi:hypothetical protein
LVEFQIRSISFAFSAIAVNPVRATGAEFDVVAGSDVAEAVAAADSPERVDATTW